AEWRSRRLLSAPRFRGRWTNRDGRGGPTVSAAAHAARLNVLYKSPVKLRPSVAEEAEGSTVFLGCGEVEGGDEDAGFLRSELRENVAAFIADEAMTIKALAMLGADAVV